MIVQVVQESPQEKIRIGGTKDCNNEFILLSAISLLVYVSKKENLFDIEDQRVIIMSVHEFGHGYVNPLTEQYLKENDIPDLFSDIADVMRKQAYGKISSIINEHVIRAIVIRYISLIYHDEAWVQRAIQNEKKRGFIYIEDILESLEEYENQRQNYPTFDLYYPMIVKHLETVKAR